MIADSLSTWLAFLTSPAAPKGAMSPMELDGYLTGIVVSPDLLFPSRWLDRIWGENEPNIDYRPLYLAASGKPNHDVVRIWVRGFGKAMALAPAPRNRRVTNLPRAK
jgi:uncharacterized protein